MIKKIVHDQTNKYLLENNILCNFQSEFRPSHPTNLCLTHLTDKILKGFDEGLLTGMMLIDLQKAFNKINHKVLLQKLKAIRFSEESIQLLRFYLCGQIFLVETENKFLDFGKISFGVPQSSIPEPLLFLIYVNDIPQVVKSNLLLYDDSGLVYLRKNIGKIKKVFDEDFENICDWFVDNKLSIHFEDGKSKSILFVSKQRARNIRKLNIRYKEINTKQQAQVTHLGCGLGESMSGEPMALKVVNKINAKPKFLYRKDKFLATFYALQSSYPATF